MSKSVRYNTSLVIKLASALVAASSLNGHQGSASAMPIEVLNGSTVYTLDVTSCFAPGTLSPFCGSAKNFQANTWFGNSALAKDLSEAAKDALGLYDPVLGANLGPNFVFYSGDSSQFNSSALPFEGFEWDPVLARAISRGGTWNSATGDGTSRTYWLVTETASPRVVGPIVAANNGLPVNTTTSLLAKTLLPEFEGGTLVVSSPGVVIVDNFTLKGLSTNTIDSAGNNATFSGVFSDKANSIGNINFVDKSNSGQRGSVTLSSRSNYSGFTIISDNGKLLIGVDNALPSTTNFVVRSGGSLDLNGFNQAVATLNGDGGAIELRAGALTLAKPTLSKAISSASISGSGALVKDGLYTQVLSGALAFTGETKVKGGTLIINGTSSSSTSVESGATLGGTGAITGTVINSGIVSPGNSIGTLTINGDYTQNPGATLALEVGGGGTGDLLQINGGRVTDLAGQVLISSAPGTSITAGLVYTGIATSPTVAYAGASTANAAFGTITGDAGYRFVREDDSDFIQLNNGAATKDPTKLQFGWLQLKPSVESGPIEQEVILPGQTLTGTDTIEQVKQQGGSITQVVSAPLQFVSDTCLGNTDNSSNCSALIGPPSGSGPGSVSPNSLTVAKVVDAGKASIDSGLVPIVVDHPTTAQQQIVNPNANVQQQLTSGVKPVVTPHGDGNFKIEFSSAGKVQTSILSKEPQVDSNADGTYTVSFAASGGLDVLTVNSQSAGLNTTQLSLAGVNSDFLNVYTALFSIPTRSELNQALHSITAEPYASMQSVALEAMEQFRINTLALTDSSKSVRLFTEANMCRLDDGTLVPADSDPRPDNCKPLKMSKASRWSLLIDATNTQAKLEGTNDLASLDYNIFQSTYGLQYDASKQWSLGASFGYGQANLYNYEYANSSIDSDTYSGGAWAIYRPADDWKITGMLGYMNLQYDSSRQIAFGGLNRTANAGWSGNGFTSAIDLEYEWVLSGQKAHRNAIRLKPNTYLAYSLHSQGNITETGAESLNLAVDGHTADSLVYGIGFTLETPIQVSTTSRLIPRLSVGYEHDFNANSNEEHALTASFAEVPALGSLEVLGQNRGANDLNVGLNVELEASDQLSIYAGVGGSFWSNGNELSYGGGIRWRFGGAPNGSIAQSKPQVVRP